MQSSGTRMPAAVSACGLVPFPLLPLFCGGGGASRLEGGVEGFANFPNC